MQTSCPCWSLRYTHIFLSSAYWNMRSFGQSEIGEWTLIIFLTQLQCHQCKNPRRVLFTARTATYLGLVRPAWTREGRERVRELESRHVARSSELCITRFHLLFLPSKGNCLSQRYALVSPTFTGHSYGVHSRRTKETNTQEDIKKGHRL